jgi:hypothetical protein
LGYSAFAAHARVTPKTSGIADFIFTDIATIFVSPEGFRYPYHDFMSVPIYNEGFH